MKTSLKKLTSVFLAVLMFISVFSVVGVSAADTDTTATGGSTVVLDASQVDPGDYYLVGCINAVDVEGNDYHFENGQLTLSVTSDTYVAVKNGAGEWYMTHGFPGMDATSTTLYKTYYGEEGTDKFFLPTGEITLTLTENGDGTLNISYSNGGGGDNPGPDPNPNPNPGGGNFVAVIYCEASGNDDASRNSEHDFVNGILNYDFQGDSYIFIRNKDTGVQYCTDGWTWQANPVTLVNENSIDIKNFNKFYVPEGNHTLYLKDNGDDTYQLSYDMPFSGGDITDPVVTDPVVTEPVITDPVVTDPETTIPGQKGLNIITALNGTTVSAPTNVTGKTVSVSYSLTAPLLLEDAQGTLNYDSSKLKLTKFEVPNVSSQLTIDLELPNAAKFNFTGVNGVTNSGIYDFKNGAVLVKATFSVVDGVTGSTTIDLVIEELDGLEGGNQVAYFTNSTPSDAASAVIPSLSNPKVESSYDTVPVSSPTANTTATDSNNNPTCSISSTNNVASTQTVTLFMYSDMGISGYYWGKNPNYRSNTYTSSSSTSVTKTISESGTYYLTVKDTSGNISSTQSIRFCETTLNANGGKVSNKKILTLINKKITLPTPTKSGYTFVGWSTISSSDIGVKTITPISNSTYYAIWKKDSINPNISTGKDSGHEILSESDKRKAQKISAKSYTKTYGNKAFSLKAKTSGNGKLTYKTSNKKVVTVSTKGKVTIKGCGKATITIKAKATSKYKSASKKITVTVKPKKVTIKSGNGSKKSYTVYFKPHKTVSGFECTFNKGNKKYKRLISGKSKSITIKNLIKGSCLIKIRAYKKVNGKKIYGSYGKIKLSIS